MNAEHPARLLALPATMLLLILHVPSARADRAENAFVTVRAVGAGVTRVDGRNFSADGDAEVELTAQPGWRLLTPSRVKVTKGQSPRYRVKSVSNEDDGHGDLYWTETEQILHHQEDPSVLAQVSVGGPYVYAAPDEGINVVLSGTAAATPGTHVVETRTTVYKNGAVVSTSASNSAPFPLELDQWSWEWSLGPESGTTNVQSFSTEPVFLPHGTHTAHGKATGSSSRCTACKKSDTASTNFPVSLLAVACNPWVGQDRTGDPSAPYESPKVTATASLDPENPAVGKVTWGGVNKCEKRDPQDWSITLWTEDREKASDTYLGEKVTASVAGATATTNFTIVKVDVQIEDVLSIGDKEAHLPYAEQVGPALSRYASVTLSAEPDDLPEAERFSAKASNSGDLFCETLSLDPLIVDAIDWMTPSQLRSNSFLLEGAHASQSLNDQYVELWDVLSGAKAKDLFTVHKISCEPLNTDNNTKGEERHRFGVGEYVEFSILPALSPVSWFATAGNLESASSSKCQFENPHRAATPIVRATLGATGSLQQSIQTVEPDAVYGTLVSENVPRRPWGQDEAWACMEVAIHVMPLDVRFSRVLVREHECDASNVSGYFADPRLWPESRLQHKPTKGWVGIEYTLDNPVTFPDFIASGLCPPDATTGNWQSGSFSWNIPGSWKVDGTINEEEKYFETWGIQETCIWTDGTVSVEKFDCSVTRNVGD